MGCRQHQGNIFEDKSHIDLLLEVCSLKLRAHQRFPAFLREGLVRRQVCQVG